MILIAHIVLAVSSIIYTTFLYFNPAPSKFRNAYWLSGLTVASGTALVFFENAQILSTCLSGLFYIGLVTVGIVAAKRKLARLVVTEHF